ncbi:MAG: LytTR family transcriptional regulator [Chitinophagaceae bacterium]|nr:LytTR family transcriptional regulator [Chitinophagaceae bacterium]
MLFLRQPFPNDISLSYSIRLSTSFAVFISLFLIIFRPFDMDSLPRQTIIISSLILGLVTFSCIFLCDFLLPRIFPDFFKEDKWTTGKQILDVLFVLLVIGSVNFLLFPKLFGGALNWDNFLHVQGLTIVVGILPISIFTLLKQNVWLRQFKKEAALLQDKLQEKKQTELPTSPASQHPTISFTGENNNEKFMVEDHQLIYIESASNYVKLFFEKNGRVNYTIIRSTMKKVEEILQGHAMFFRCHRTYIVNLDKVEAVEGNAQGYKLKITGSEERLPVSRNLNKEFSDRLLAVRPEALA